MRLPSRRALDLEASVQRNKLGVGRATNVNHERRWSRPAYVIGVAVPLITCQYLGVFDLLLGWISVMISPVSSLPIL